jgi:hypothetical protein
LPIGKATKTCKAISSGIVSLSKYKKTFKTREMTMWAFIKSNYFDIAKEVSQKTQEYNVVKKKLLVEINFYGDAPALRNEFKVWLTSGFSDESSVADAPDWFHAYREKKDVVRYLREEHEQLIRDDLLVACRACNGLVTVQRLDFSVGQTKQLFSEEVVESIGREDYDQMVAYVEQSITNRYFEKRSGLE